MTKDETIVVSACIAAVSIVSAAIIHYQNERIIELEGELRIKKNIINIWKRQFVRSVKMHDKEALIKLYKDTLIDVKFDDIVKDF